MFQEASACSLRQRHLELDLGQLLRRLADLAQERQPARVPVDLVEQVFRHDLGKAARTVVFKLLTEPFEGFVRLAAEGVDERDVVGRAAIYGPAMLNAGVDHPSRGNLSTRQIFAPQA